VFRQFYSCVKSPGADAEPGIITWGGIFDVITMVKYIKQNIKLLILTILALVLIVINSASIIENIKNTDINRSGVSRRMVNPLTFYDKEFPEITFTTKNGKVINLPDNSNHIIIGLNEQFDRDIEKLYWYLKNFDLSKYDVDIIAVSLEKNFKESKDIDVYHYDSVKLGEFFNLSDFRNFTLIVDKNNKIKYFKYEFIDLTPLRILINKFKKEL